MPDGNELPAPSLDEYEADVEASLPPAEAADPSTAERFRSAAYNVIKIVAHGDTIEAAKEVAKHLPISRLVSSL